MIFLEQKILMKDIKYVFKKLYESNDVKDE